jgi:flavin reductase (DIM6/NTAB) family NADH-FMN oxidoreductase RutF/DNA-binding GntR family transcriptional regulator
MTTKDLSPRPVVDQAVFRDVVGYFTTGVTVVTTRDGDQRFGVTASAVSSLSLEPPMLLVCLNRRLPTCDAVTAAGSFVVNILDEHQGELATQFATRGTDKFRGVSVAEGRLGVPVLADALAHIECRVAERVDAATHTVFLGEVQTARARPGSPLAYFRGTFGRFEQALDDAVYQEIRQRVLDRKVALGEELTVDGMATDLDVGRAPVHHALLKLRAEGLVAADAAHGFRVTPVTVEVAWQAYDARAAIECGVVSQTAGRLTATEIDRLRAAAAATVPWIDHHRFVDLERYLSSNTAFHECLAGIGGNTMLLHGYRRLAMAGLMARALRGVSETNDRFIQDHVDIAEAVARGDVESARRLILDHAELGKERVKIAIDRVGGEY